MRPRRIPRRPRTKSPACVAPFRRCSADGAPRTRPGHRIDELTVSYTPAHGYVCLFAPDGTRCNDPEVEIEPSAVAAWRGVQLLEALPGGARNQVLLAGRGDRRLVVRRSTRSSASLDWELDLLEHLGEHGVGIPPVVPANDGRRHVDGVVVQEFVEGHPPRTDDDWRRVVETLTVVHQLTVGWPQRPGFASARELLVADRGGDVRLDAMPAEAVHAIRRAWRPVLTGPQCAIHGDMGAGNVLVTDAGVTLLDWDEARVDVPWFDFAFLPAAPATAVPVPMDALITAGLAWETATCWLPEPDYAKRRLAELHARSDQAQ
jgi:Phosphotransferase enzyme family